MAAYCTPDEVRHVLAREILDLVGTGGSLADADLIVDHITAAQAEVDARLCGRYQAPFADPVPPLVKALTVDVAAYLATLAYRQSVSLEAEDPVALRYARAQALFKGLADGSIDLPGVVVPGDGGAVTAGSATVRNPYDGALFTPRDFQLGYARGGDVHTRGGYPGGW